jgi:HAMP domain-containing protein
MLAQGVGEDLHRQVGAIVARFARSITAPLQKLEAATHILASGDLDTPLPVPPGDDEVARLGRAFTRMRDDLKQYIADLQTTTAANERINSELQIAQAIQLSLVPKTFPPFPDRPEFGCMPCSTRRGSSAATSTTSSCSTTTPCV